MATIQMSAVDVLPLLPEGVAVAAVNTADSVVVSGPHELVERLLGSVSAKVTRLRVSHAFHSALMDPMLGDFAQVLESVEFRTPRIPVVSNLTGEAGADMGSADYWVRQVRGTVRFADGVKVMLENMDYWRDAPVWTVSSIKDATADWFKFLGDDSRAGMREGA